MSDVLITQLQNTISTLQREKAELQAEARKKRLANKQLRENIEHHAKQLQAITAERDKLAGTAAAAPSDQAKRIAELETALRTRDHRDAFSAAIGGSLAAKVSIDDLWAKAQYEPGEAVPTPDEIRAVAAKARESAPYLFADQSQAQRATTPAAAQPQQPFWGGRGSDHAAAAAPVFTDAQLRDPVFMLTQTSRLKPQVAANGTA